MKTSVSSLSLRCILATLFPLFLSANTFAANVDIILKDTATGSAPFSNGNCDPNLQAASHNSGITYIPGEDACDNDKVIRTRDTLAFSWDVSVNSSDGNNVTVRQVLPIEMRWVFLPPQCLTTAGINPPSQISADKRSIVCNLGTVKSGTAIKITPQAVVRGSSKNGTILKNSASVAADASTLKLSETVETIVSAAPRFELQNNIGAFGPWPIKGPNGDVGHLVLSMVTIYLEGTSARGGEMLDSSQLTFDSEVKYMGTNVPNNSLLYTWGKLGANGACGYMFENKPGAGRFDYTFGHAPIGKFSFTQDPSAVDLTQYPHNASVTDSGIISCSQSSKGSPIKLSVAGMDSAADYSPVINGFGFPIPVNRTYVGSFWVKFWVPYSDAVAAGGTLQVENTDTNFDPVSLSGQSNFGTDTESPVNNSFVYRLNAGAGYGLRKDYYTDTKGNVLLVPGGKTISRVFSTLQGNATLTNSIYCDKLDNTKHIVEANPGTDEAAVSGHEDPNQYIYFEGGTYQVDYGIGGKDGTGFTWASPTDQANFECSDQNGPWYPTLSSVPGGAEAVTKVRLKSSQIGPETPWMGVYVTLRVKDIPGGTIIGNFGSFRADEIAGGAWQHTDGDPNLLATKNEPIGYLADRATVHTVNVFVKKETVPYDPTNPVLPVVAGKEATFRLKPTATANTTLPQVTTVVMEDIVPPLLTYIPGSATVAPKSVERLSDGSSKITWELTGITVGQVIPPIDYRVLVSEFTPNFTSLVNCVDISSPHDASQNDKTQPCGISRFRPKSSFATLYVTNPSSFTVSKETTTPLISPSEDIVFQVRYRNTASFDIASADIIDVLPFKGDGSGVGGDGLANTFDDFSRTPSTNYQGSLVFKSLVGNHGETFQCTKAPPSSISIDPADPSNQSGGSTTWCSCTAFGGPNCPANNLEVTAIRTSTGSLARNAPIREVSLVLSTKGNSEGDIYTNSFGARAAGLGLPVRSNDVTVSVQGGKISNQIFDDRDGNGFFDVKEEGIANVEVSAYYDLNGNGGKEGNEPLAGSAITNSQGVYEINNLNINNGTGISEYVVVVTDKNKALTDYVATSGTAGLDSHAQNPQGYPAILAPALSSATNADFGFQKLITIGDFVWIDANANGVQESDEKGLPGVTISVIDKNGKKVVEQISDSKGFYKITRLVAGSYKLKVTLPSGYKFTKIVSTFPSQNSDFASNGETDLRFFPASADDLSVDLGLVPLPGSIGDLVWEDLNANGIQDPSEPPISGVALELYNSLNQLIDKTATDSSGSYSFKDINPGSYRVKIIKPIGFAYSPTGGASNDRDSDASDDGISSNISITNNLNNSTVDFGLFKAVNPQCREIDNKPAQIKVDNMALELRSGVSRALKYRVQAAEAGECEVISDREIQSIRLESSKLYSLLWTSVWTDVPSNTLDCGSENMPTNCSVSSLSQVKSSLNSGASKYDSLITKTLGSCNYKNRRSTMLRSSKKRGAAFSEYVAALPDTTVVCKAGLVTKQRIGKKLRR